MNAAAAGAPLLSLDGAVAMVTGGSGAIGAAVVDRLIEAGARVAAVDIPGKPGAAGAEAFECDVGDEASVRELFARFEKRFDGRLDVLVHCAGITRDAVLWKMTQQAWAEVLRVNLDSAFLLLRAAVPLLRDRSSGAVALISSINGERGKFGQANYSASKAGLLGLGRTAARELGRFGIRVNVVAPGLIDTPMTAALPDEVRRASIEESALGRPGTPDDVARTVLFLVSPMSRHVTGQVLRVDGGQLMA